MKRVCAILYFAVSVSLSGNGGGYHRGGLASSGDVMGFEPEGTGKVRIVDEKLEVELGESMVQVRVRYLMRNMSGKRVKVRFGFPVEEGPEMALGEGLDGKWTKKNDSLQYVRDYRIEAGGKRLKTEWEVESKPAIDKRFAKLKGWLISELRFDAGEEKVVRISFGSAYEQSMEAVSDDVHEGALKFVYRLSTGAVWEGPIGNGRIELKPVGIPAGELRVIKPVNRFRREGDSWVWDFKDLEPTLADDLKIEVRPAVDRYWRPLEGKDWEGPRGEFVKRGESWSVRHANYQATARSTLPDDGDISYGVDNLKSPWRGKAWSEGAEGSGAGAWLGLVPQVAKPLSKLLIDPGYFKSEALFRANPRPKKVTVLLNGEHRVEARIPDLRRRVTIPLGNYHKPVSKIRLTVDEVWPGDRHEDLCISYVGLEAELDEKPEVRGAR
jgi:hypothetical protein